MTDGLSAAIRARRGDLDLDLALAVAAGETVAVVGPNGAGKSTLLALLAGLQRPDAGRIEVADAAWEDTDAGVHVPAERRSVGFVFQEHRLFPHLSARDNVAFGLRANGLPRRAARAEAETWLTDLGLATRAGAMPATLSGGEAQRVALARALARRPQVLLLDEPLSALDVTTRIATRHELRRHLDAFPGAAVLVTHDPLEAMALADRLVVLEGGHVVQEGSAEDIAARPRSAYVGDLVGVNLFRGRAGDGGVTLERGHLAVAHNALGAGDVFAIVHPRAVALHRRRPDGSARNVWPGTTRALEPQGDRVRVRVALDEAAGGPPAIVAEVTAAAVRELGLDGAGVPVWVSVKATEVDVYPA